MERLFCFSTPPLAGLRRGFVLLITMPSTTLRRRNQNFYKKICKPFPNPKGVIEKAVPRTLSEAEG